MMQVTSNQLVEYFGAEQQPSANLDTSSVVNCRLYLEHVVQDIEAPRVRRVIGAVFQDLTRLLECLMIIEGHLRHIHTAEESLAFFHLIRDEAKSLMEFIRMDAVNCDQISGELADTLDGITFALSHDLRRVFEGENEATGDKPPYVVLGRVHRAHDVLTNCLQQSTISLAVLFDKTLVGTKLFNNSEKRYRQSLKLCSDLAALRQLIQEFIDRGADRTDLTAALEKFRNHSLEFLMYSDWPQFESFCERIQMFAGNPSALAPVLHQFLCYVETLLRQVKMRAVLADDGGASTSGHELNWESENAVWSLPNHDTDRLPEFACAV